jgi:hypothetical protein
MIENDFFICTYTNRVKQYCDKQFFSHLQRITINNQLLIVDNTADNGEYADKLRCLIKKDIIHIVPERRDRQFLYNVIESVNLCRAAFLESCSSYMVIVESDVIPPVNVLTLFKQDIKTLEESNYNWGIIGAVYYTGYHDFNLKGLVQVHEAAVLSGCTVYKRSLIEQCSFTGHPVGHLSCFPDACMTFESRQRGLSTWNDHNILCAHLHKGNGDRGHNDCL